MCVLHHLKSLQGQHRLRYEMLMNGVIQSLLHERKNEINRSIQVEVFYDIKDRETTANDK